MLLTRLEECAICCLQEVHVLQQEIAIEESRFHYVSTMHQMMEFQQQRVNEEMKLYTSSDPADKKKSMRQL